MGLCLVVVAMIIYIGTFKPELLDTFFGHTEVKVKQAAAQNMVTVQNPTTNTIDPIASSTEHTEPTVKILTFGDLMLDRLVRKNLGMFGYDYPFKNILEFLKGNDIVLANLEGPVTSNPSKTIDFKNKTLQFTFDPAVVPILKNVGFTVLGLANNHSFNFGVSGFAETKTHLKDAGIDFYGDPYNQKDISIVKDINGVKVGIVGYHEFYNEDTTPIVNELKRLRGEVDFLIVTPHWGVEYNTSMTAKQQEKAYAFIDAGADLVLGAHPHVIEPVEVYKNKMIFYSLGNFVFDQGSDFDISHGLSVGITLKKTAVEYHIFPISIVRTQVSLADDVTREQILSNLAEKSNHVPNDIKVAISNGVVTISNKQ